MWVECSSAQAGRAMLLSTGPGVMAQRTGSQQSPSAQGSDSSLQRGSNTHDGGLQVLGAVCMGPAKRETLAMCYMTCTCGSADGTTWERLGLGEGSQRIWLACVQFWDLGQS